MLNLNYNIIGSSNIGGVQPFRAGAVYSVRNDPFSASIVVAIPGNLFYDGDYENQFGMNYAWDDISAYIRGNGTPIGSNLTVSTTTTGSFAIISASTDTIKWPAGDARYDTSLMLDGTSSLTIQNTWGAKEGANLSFSASFVIESWIAWEQTASATYVGPTENDYSWTPDRYLVYKYDPANPATSQYLWNANWGGDTDPGIGSNIVSGSSRFVYDYTTPPLNYENYLYSTSSLNITPLQWIHYAVSYTSKSLIDGFFDRYLRIYINGQCKNEYKVGISENLNQDTTELLQLFGAIDPPDVYKGSKAYFQDFRMYNGTNKDYTGSLIPLPESMVVWD